MKRWVKTLGLGLLACGCGADELVREDTSLEKQRLDPSTLNGQCVRISASFNGTERFLDAYTTGNRDVVTRAYQSDGTQRWCLTSIPYATGGQPGGAGFGGQGSVPQGFGGFSNSFRYTLRHRTPTGQFLDAYPSGSDNKAVRLGQYKAGVGCDLTKNFPSIYAARKCG